MTAKVTLNVTMNTAKKHVSLVGLVLKQIVHDIVCPKIMNKAITTALKQEKKSVWRTGMGITVQCIAKNTTTSISIVTGQQEKKFVTQIGTGKTVQDIVKTKIIQLVIFIAITYLAKKSAILTGMESIVQNIVKNKMIRADITLAKSHMGWGFVIQDGMELTALCFAEKKMDTIRVTKRLG